MSGGKVDNLQPFLFSIVHRIGRPAAPPVEVADTHATVVYQMAVPLVHTAPGVRLGGIDHLICQNLDAFIFRRISGGPAPCLRQAGQDKDQLDMRITLLLSYLGRRQLYKYHIAIVIDFPSTDQAQEGVKIRTELAGVFLHKWTD